MWWRKRLLPKASARRATERGLHRLLRQGLRDLGIQPPLSVEALSAALGDQRGRPIELQARALPVPGPSGLWVETGQVDVILYQEQTTRFHQDHIILHELGHIVLSDRSRRQGKARDRQDPASISQCAAMLGLAPEAVRRVLRRCAYDSGEECAVELAATILLEWDSVVGIAPPSLAADPAVRRVQNALGDRRGWP
ncbi:hypothetical protein ACWF94_17565 [Streptomyces sp. NPDC055078]